MLSISCSNMSWRYIYPSRHGALAAMRPAQVTFRNGCGTAARSSRRILYLCHGTGVPGLHHQQKLFAVETRASARPDGFTSADSRRSPPLPSPSFSGSSSRSRSNGTGASATPFPSPPVSSQQNASRRAAQLADLLQETARLTMAMGPGGLRRGVQAADAFFSLGREYLQRGHVDPPQVVLRRLFEKLGATYIKLGQFVASSPSLFPDEYVLEFQKCLDQTDPVPFPVIKATIEAELGRPWQEVFSTLDPVPLACASVAQVHAATLRNNNKSVVLKVLKPGVEDVLTADMNFVYLASRLLEFMQPELSRLSLTGVLGDVRASMLDEVDFEKEAVHLQQFSNFLDVRGLRGVATCPYVYKQFSSKRLLVMERLNGAPLTDLAAIRSITTKEPESVLISALNTWFASVLGSETFHADVHAGNLMVLPDGRVGFLDFGIVGRISPVTWKAVEALITSLALADYDTMARALATIGATGEDVDCGAFARDLKSFFAELDQVSPNVVISNGGGGGRPGSVSTSLEVDQMQLNRLFLELVRLGETHGVRFPREFGLFLKQLLYFDRYTRILAPSLQVLRDDRINLKNLSQQYGDRL